ncbi:MAG: DUF2460 domain-containing protein [Rhizobiaceae bacterium]|nr:DUF2460 domain-containing protein [Rhizobiaceae bacterium]
MAEFESFHEILFPTAISFGATGGPERRNEIVRLTSGAEQRNARFQASRRRYDVGTGVRSLEDLQELIAFFEARRGSLHGFRFRDPFERRSGAPAVAVAPTDQQIGTGDGSNRDYQLTKIYGAGADGYQRPITKPVAGTVRVAVGGVEKTLGADFEVDVTTGIVTFVEAETPGSESIVTAGFEFDVPVRFDIEHLSVSLTAFEAGQVPTIPLVEISA